MKILNLIIFFCCSISCFCQDIILDKIKDKLNSGIFVRLIEDDFVEQIEVNRWGWNNIKAELPDSSTPIKRRRLNYFRFFDIEKKIEDISERPLFIGKLFLSHAYYEEDFDSLFSDTTSFIRNKNGFYMLFKLFKTNNGNYEINIYPNFNNICNPKEHDAFIANEIKNNEKQHFPICPTIGDHFKIFEEHVLKKDYEIEDIWSLSKKDKANYLKYFKNFKVNIENFTLDYQYTKRDKSLDRVQTSSYQYEFRCFERIEAIGSFNAIIAYYRLNKPFITDDEVNISENNAANSNGVSYIYSMKKIVANPTICNISNEDEIDTLIVSDNQIFKLANYNPQKGIVTPKEFWIKEGIFKGNTLITPPKIELIGDNGKDKESKKYVYKTTKNIFAYDSNPTNKTKTNQQKMVFDEDSNFYVIKSGQKFIITEKLSLDSETNIKTQWLKIKYFEGVLR